MSLHHEYEHRHYRPREQQRLKIALAITTVTMVVEAIGGYWTHSLALLSDAGHMFSHLFALGISLFAIVIAARPADEQRSFGFYRAEILAALLNGLSVLAVAVWIIIAAYHRLRAPEAIAAGPMFVIAVIGLTVNGATAWLLHDVAGDDLNVKGAFLHVLSDLASSVGVVGAAIAIHFTGWWPADPIVSLIIALVITIWSVNLFKDSIHILLQSTPKGFSSETIAAAIVDNITEVHAVHHIHLWEMTKGMIIMTAHLELDDVPLSQADIIRERAQTFLRERFAIGHASLLVECRRNITPRCGDRATLRPSRP